VNITIVCDVLGESNNGTTITARRLIDQLKDRGHNVKVISPSLVNELGYFQVPTINFGFFNRYIEKNGVKIAKADKKILSLAIQGADVVHIMLPFSLGKAAIKMCKENGIPVTAGMHIQAENVTAHIYLKNAKWANSLVYRVIRNVLYKKVDAIHYPSLFISHTARDHGFQAPRYVISNGVIPLFHPQVFERPISLKGRFVILYIGRLVREKRHDILLKALKFSKYEKDIQLIFAGNGPLEESIKRLGSTLTNQPIMGFYPKEELVKIINYSDLYVHPSDVEIEAISCLEAISCGLVPVISDSPQSATRAFALGPEHLFDHRLPSDLAAKIDYWIEHPELKKDASQRYLVFSKRFAISSAIDRMEEMFKDAISAHQSKI
jgi:glycosyltransferase involved in cell wall biosynthesis